MGDFWTALTAVAPILTVLAGIFTAACYRYRSPK